MKLINEYIDFQSLEMITEGIGGKSVKIKGPFLRAEVKNRNGRIYKQTLIEREVARYNKEKIATKRAVGELDHPANPSINLDRVSHLIESLEMEGNSGIGVAKILDTPMGKIAKSLIKEGVSLGVSTRGVGTLDGDLVNENYNLITVDLVSDPSNASSFVEGVLENKEYIMNGNNIVEVAVKKLEKKLDNKGMSGDIKDFMLGFIQDINKNL